MAAMSESRSGRAASAGGAEPGVRYLKNQFNHLLQDITEILYGMRRWQFAAHFFRDTCIESREYLCNHQLGIDDCDVTRR